MSATTSPLGPRTGAPNSSIDDPTPPGRVRRHRMNGPRVVRGGGPRQRPLAPAAAVLALAAALSAFAAPIAWAAAPVEESRPAERAAAPTPVAPAQQPAAQPSQLAQLFSLVQRLQQEVNQLRGQVEDQAHRLERLGREQQERYLDLDRRLAGTSSAQATLTAPSEAEPAGAGALAGTPSAAPTTEQGAYQAAYTLLDRGEFQAAAQAMERVIEDYPNGQYTANAFYWLAELHRRNGDLENARQALVQVITLYPDHGKIPDALFKVGVVYAELDDAERARGYLEQVVREHPTTTAASLAKDYLAELP